MKPLPFIKMHGAGNDYVFVDGFETDCADAGQDFAVRVSDRHFGIGADGLIMMQPPTDDSHDVQMQMWNADGSVGRMCGNGARCVALWMRLRNRIRRQCRIHTQSRIVTAQILQVDEAAQAGIITVDMGAPDLSQGDAVQEIKDLRMAGAGIDDVEYREVSIGNRHAVVFTDELTDRRVRQIGALIQRHERFAEGVNVEWVRVDSGIQLTVRIFERGSGETLACGSGACAAVVAAINRGVCRRGENVIVSLPGGQLTVNWQPSGTILLTGPAELSFTGQWAS